MRTRSPAAPPAGRPAAGTGRLAAVARRAVPILMVLVLPGLGITAVAHDSKFGVYLVYLAVAGTALAAERLIPWLPVERRRPWRARGTDLVYLVTSSLLFYAIQEFVIPATQYVRDALLGDHRLWPGHLPVPAQVVLTLLLLELVYYGIHRVNHGDNWLWRTHRIHHSSDTFDWLMGWRIHWFSEILNLAVRFVPLIALGVPQPVATLGLMVVSSRSMFPHLNADVRSGTLLNLLLNTPEVHRWHHLQDPKLSACNFGDSTVIWDHVFRTYRKPGVTREALFGVPASEQLDDNWVRHLLSPWQRAKAASAGHR